MKNILILNLLKLKIKIYLFLLFVENMDHIIIVDFC